MPKIPKQTRRVFIFSRLLEKALKAWLAFKGVDYPKTHDLNPLLGLLEDQDENIGPFWTLLELNPFAVQFRYELPGEEFSNFKQLAQLTQKLMAFVQSLLARG